MKPPSAASRTLKHSHFEDAQALLTGTLFAALVPLDRIGLSLLGMAAINAALAINHRPGRYVAT
ncbi:hypothetical protein [Roseateles sp. P5_E11]